MPAAGIWSTKSVFLLGRSWSFLLSEWQGSRKLRHFQPMTDLLLGVILKQTFWLAVVRKWGHYCLCLINRWLQQVENFARDFNGMTLNADGGRVCWYITYYYAGKRVLKNSCQNRLIFGEVLIHFQHTCVRNRWILHIYRSKWAYSLRKNTLLNIQDAKYSKNQKSAKSVNTPLKACSSKSSQRVIVPFEKKAHIFAQKSPNGEFVTCTNRFYLKIN